MITLLAIDDHQDNLISLKALISEFMPDSTVLTATTGQVGLELAITKTPDVILLDIVMPGMDGFDVCVKLKQDPRTKDIPVVFLTALRGDKESRIRALEVGGDAFLAKPIDETELTAQIKAMVKIRTNKLSENEEKKRLKQLVDEQTRSLIRQVEELKERDNALLNAKEKAEQSDRLKSAFLANMSHEIRTPMNAIVGFAQVLTDPDLTPLEREHFAKIIQRRSDDLLHIINAILDISQIESGTFTLIRREVKINELLEELKTLYHDKIPAERVKFLKLTLETPLPAAKATIVTDPYILRQVLTNLLDNALKYTSSGTISFGYKPVKNEAWTFFVSDTGIGISRENQEIIFDHFRQAEIPDAQFHGGTGLGLAICKGLLHQLGGDIRVESALHKGSLFTFSLPLLPTGKGQGNRFSWSKSNPGKTLGMNWMGKRLLVVEDDAPNCEYLKIILSRTAAVTEYATNARELRQRYDRLNEFDLVLLDIRLPDANGWDLIGEIRQIRADLPVIAQTAYALASDQQKSREHGFDAYIAKPIKREQLLTLIDTWLKKIKE